MIDSVFHKHADIPPSNPDWKWLRQGISEMRERQVRFPAVHLLANGTLTAGPVPGPEIAIMGDVQDPKNGVLFCDHSHGLFTVLKTTWVSLEAGKHFPVRPKV